VLETSAKEHGSGSGGGEIRTVQMDQTDKASIKAAVEEISKQEKCIHLLVNNAGITQGKIALDDNKSTPEKLSEAIMAGDVADWDACFRTNVTGYCARPSISAGVGS
jgi:NAD(P)-dependent dehydrogenase (short-subunit alcohol dehydrogenase family)